MGKPFDASDFEDVAPPAAAPSDTFDPSDFEDAGPPPRERIGPWQAAGVGTVAGFTSDFDDELAGVGKVLTTPGASFGDGTYTAGRDPRRELKANARADQPVPYVGAEVFGSIAQSAVPIPGLAPARTAAGIGTRIAAEGFAAGVGASDREDVGGMLKDGAWGAGAGLATGGTLAAGGAGIRKLAAGAPDRQAIRNVDALLEKTPAVRTQDKANAVLGGKEGISKVLKREGLEKYVRKAGDGLAMAQEKLDDVGDQIGSIYARADAAAPGGVATRKEVYDRLGLLLQKYAENNETGKFAALKTEMGKLQQLDEFRTSNGSTIPAMTATQLHSLKKNLGNLGYGAHAPDIAPQDAKQAARDATEIVRDLLAERVDKSIGEADKLGKLNTQWRELHTVRDVFDAKAKRDDRMSPSLGQRMGTAAKHVVDAGAIAGSLAAGNAWPLAASVAIRGAPHVPRAMDGLLIALGNAAKKGGDPAQLIQRAVQIGIPEATATAVVQAHQGGGAPMPY